jgi:plasmid stability protein
MGQLLVRGLDDSLRRRAQRNGRSVKAERRATLELVLEPETKSFAELAAPLRAEIPPSTLNSTDLVHEDRDRDYSCFPGP